jgi:2-iminobutanoate/2-iminopropanoate deaminase
MRITEIGRMPRSYSQAVALEQGIRLLFVSGQIPVEPGMEPPADFGDQCRLAWANVMAVLTEAGMEKDNLIKITVLLSDRRYRDENARIRQEVLGGHRPALTVIITEIYDEAWLLEIEVIAAA